MLTDVRRSGLMLSALLLMGLAIGCGSQEPPRTTRSTTPPPKSGGSETPATSDGGTSETPPATPATPVGPAGEGWGHFKGRFVLSGDAPTPAKLTVDKDVEFCGKFDLHDESLVVNPMDKGIRDVVVFVYGTGDKTPQVHESYEEQKKAEVVLDNKGCRFAPHVCALWTEQTLTLKNDDQVGHNTKIDCLSNAPINQILPTGQTLEQHFMEVERLPVNVSCNIHPWMKGYLVIRDSPYMAVTDEHGNFEIKNLPAGTWEFVAWQSESGYIAEVTMDGKKTAWSKGRFEVPITDGAMHDMGDIQVAPALFQK